MVSGSISSSSSRGALARAAGLRVMWPRRISARFGVGDILRGVRTQVPLVLLSIPLPGVRHLAVLTHPSLVRAAPTLSGTSRIGLPSAPPPCCDRVGGEGLPPPLDTTAPHGAQARYVTNRGFPPLMLAFAQMIAATVLLALTLPLAGCETPELTATVVAITVLGVLGTGIAYVINYAPITTEGPTAASVVTYLVPAVAVALGATFLSPDPPIDR